jgi:hypothetical protein
MWIAVAVLAWIILMHLAPSPDATAPHQLMREAAYHATGS